VSGPLEGGTRLTVVGMNLGVTSDDIEVSIGGVLCHSVNYIRPTTQYVNVIIIIVMIVISTTTTIIIKIYLLE